MKEARKSILPGIILFVLCIVLGLATYQDYGIGWDEHVQREMGQISYNYVFKGDQTLLTHLERDHGVGVEVPLIMIEELLDISKPRDIYLMRHLVSHLFFLVCMFAGYLLFLRLFKKQWLACLGLLMLVFYPRIYAHSFVNTKDVPFAAMFLVSLACIERAYATGRRGWYILAGIACGYMTSIRIMGVMLVGLMAGFLILEIIKRIIDKQSPKRAGIGLLLFLICFCGALIATWPLLWTNPIGYFVEAFQSMSRFRWEGEVLLHGASFDQTEIPWYYIPLWIVITLPHVWLLLGVAGLILTSVLALKHPIEYLFLPRKRFLLLCLISVVLPIAAVIALKSVVYDDWRHLYFIYPPLVVLMLFAINVAWEKFPARRSLVITIPGIELLIVGAFFVKNHPYTNVYFNRLVSHEEEYLRKHHDLDYWGMSIKQGYEYILEHDDRNEIRVAHSTPPVGLNLNILTDHQRERIKLVPESASPDYYITTFRNHPEDYPWPVFHKVKVLNSSILTVYNLKGEE